MESWENFEPPAVIPVPSANKWAGEDEDEDLVKDSWEDEDEDKESPKEESKEVVEQKPKKKSLMEKIAEKEKQKREEMEKRLREQEDEISPEERLRMQKESDLKIALETTFGGDNNNSPETIDGLTLPTTKEEFQEFSDNLSKKLLVLTKSAEYPGFVENHVRSLCAPMSSLDIKKIKNTLDNLYLEKQKIEKGEKSKKSKGKGKAKLKLEDENQLSAYVNDFEDFDDFM